MKGKVILTLLCLFFQCLVWTLPSVSPKVNQNPQVIYVPINYTTIQAGINAALPGDTVFVQIGLYYEHVVVNKSIELIGEHPETTIIDGNGTGTSVLVTSSNAIVSDFTVQNGTYGILVENADDVTINRNNVVKNREGITLYNSRNCSVSENNSSFNVNRGIFLNSCWDSIVYKNVALNNSNQYGINANASRNIALLQNTAIGNYWDGLGLQSSTNCFVWGNNVSRNQIFGIWCDSSYNSVIYHNILVNNTLAPNNTINAITNTEILWDSGYPSGGNYWSDYLGNDTFSSPNQDQLGSDGIGDTPYSIVSENQDRYPLIQPRNNGSAIFLALQNRTILPGDNILMYGILWPKLTGANITIYHHLQGETEWNILETVSTQTGGKFSHNWTYTNEGTYELKTSWTGNSTTFSAESLIETLTVKKVASTISIPANLPMPIPAGSAVTITGRITPTRPNVNVTIWYHLIGETWIILETLETYENSSYSFTWLTNKAGVFEIKSSWKGDEITSPANSSAMIIVVLKVSSNMTLYVNHTTTTVGSNITISGTIDPPRVNVNVTIQYKLLNTAVWVILDTIKTDFNSYYTYIWQTTETGKYEIMAHWQGDLASLEAQSNIVIVTVEGELPVSIVLLTILAIVVLIIFVLLMYFRKKQKH